MHAKLHARLRKLAKAVEAAMERIRINLLRRILSRLSG